jgi:hypothetical protein
MRALEHESEVAEVAAVLEIEAGGHAAARRFAGRPVRNAAHTRLQESAAAKLQHGGLSVGMLDAPYFRGWVKLQVPRGG